MPWKNSPDPFINAGERRETSHKFGETQSNHYHVANSLDGDPVIPCAGPPKDHDPDTYPMYVCWSCGYRAPSEPMECAGDECVGKCPECGKIETFELKRISLWEEENNG